ALLGAFAFHAWRRARDPDAAGVIVALAAAAAFYGSGLVLPGAQSIQWIPWVCVGVALASELRSARVVMAIPPLRLPAILQLLIVIGLAGVAFGQVGSLEANRAAKAGEAALGGANSARAVDMARTATTVDPGRAAYWNDLGRALELVPDLSGARAAYRQATTRSPYTPAFWWNLGGVELELAKQNEPGAREAAYEAMRRALAADPQNPESFDRFAHIQLALADYSGAIESERRAIALFPTVPGYYTFASEAAHQLGDSATAIAFLRQGVAALNSNDLRITLARRLIEANRLPEARQVLSDVRVVEPTNAAALGLETHIGAQLPAAFGLGSAVLLLALPYLQLRLVDDFAGVRPLVLRACLAGFIAGIAAIAIGLLKLVVLPAALPVIVVLALLYFVGFCTYAGVVLIREAREAKGVARNRMVAAACGALALSLTLIVALTSTIVGPTASSVASMVLALASAVGYVVAFAPPVLLKRAWREPALRSFLIRA